MHFALETDYAVRMVAVLADAAQNGVESMSASAIGNAACVPKPTALKVLRQLKIKGILCSGIGVNGGYRLSLAQNKISVADVIEAVEGKFKISRCIDSDYVCSRTGYAHEKCKFHKIFVEINSKLYGELLNVTFEGNNI